MSVEPYDPRDVVGVGPERLPAHVAIIMDGNGRWAERRGLPRVEGHRAGTEAVRETVTAAARLGLKWLTLYSFSLENWSRPADEVRALMDLYAEHLVKERPTLMDNNVRLVQAGRREGLPDFVLRELDRTVAMTRENTGLTLCLALNYGGRAEIVDAVRAIARRVAGGELEPESIDERTFADHLYLPEMPDPDLLIRTANERRVSNFLLWQISYAEIHVTDVLWPDFREAHLFEALRDYAGRERRFGGVVPRGCAATGRDAQRSG